MSVFLDTNILLYACMEQDAEKMRIAVDLLRQSDCHISVQSLNEMTNTLRRKTKLSLDDIGELVSDIRSLTTVHDLTTSVYARGWAIVRRYGLQTYDSLILACAIENGHETVLSEDMQNGLSLFGMTIIRNPFEGIYKYSEVS